MKNEKLPELDEVGKLKVQLEKTQMKLQDQSQNIEAMTNCTICEEFVSIEYKIFNKMKKCSHNKHPVLDGSNFYFTPKNIFQVIFVNFCDKS